MSRTIAPAAIMKALALHPRSLLLLDSAPLIYLVEGRGRRRATMEALFEAASSEDLRLEISALAWAELLRKAPGPEIALAYRRLLSDSTRLVVLPVDVAIADAAADILRNSGQNGSRDASLADAIHLASGFVTGAAAILTNDEAWVALAPRGLRIILLDELAALLA